MEIVTRLLQHMSRTLQAVTAELDGKALREAKGAEIGQDAEFFFKVFDRVYVKTDMDYYTTDVGLAMETADNDTTRVVTSGQSLAISKS